LSDIINNDTVNQPFPDFSSDPAQQAVFGIIQTALGADTLWTSLSNIDIERIQGIRDNYFANHPNMPPAETTAWEEVMGTIEGVFADKDELNGFIQSLHNLLSDRQTWTNSKIVQIGGWASLNQSLAINIGDQGRAVWSIILAPLAAVPAVGGALSAVANGIVKLAIKDGITVNPNLAAISATVAEMQGKLGASYTALVTQMDTYRDAALKDYGKLQKMHDLLVLPGVQWPDDSAFTPESLKQAEIELWKPIMNVGWQIQTAPKRGRIPPPNNSWIPSDSYGNFDAYNIPQVRNSWYDQLSVVENDGCWARWRDISNSVGDWVSQDVIDNLFVRLGVPVNDFFNGRNGWALRTIVYDGNYPFIYDI
jgi:hypothetical protein